MVKKLNSMPDYRARMPKQPHDISRSFAFTSCVGAELPVYQHMCHPHDELYFNAGCFTRLSSIALPSLAQIDFHLDYFFVPLTVMYTPANVLHYGTDDLISNMFAGDGADGLRDKFPVLNLTNGFNLLNVNEDGWHYFDDMPDPAGAAASTFMCCGHAAYRLLDMLGYNPNGVFFKGSGTTTQVARCNNPSITPWFLAAYQACHQLYFRNDDREKKDYIYNFDDKFNKYTWQFELRESNDFTKLGLLSIRYRSRYKDYFNSVKVSPLASGVSLRSFWNGSNSEVTSAEYLQGVRQFLGTSPSNSDSQFGNSNNVGSTLLGGDSTNVVFDSDSVTGISTATIRSMFALEKLVRVVGRANKDYESQVLAHFGVKVPHDVMHNITHIGHDMFSLRPEPVVSTADTSTSQGGTTLGEVGGQGQVSFSGNRHKFTAPCHGVFMTILSSIPRMRYEAGFDKALIFNERLDFWQPEFDRLGMQPLFSYEVMPQGLGRNRRVGWQFGYEHLKRKYDRISVAFTEAQGNTFSPWVLSQRPLIGVTLNDSALVAESQLGNLNYANFLVAPVDINKIMQVYFNPSVPETFEQYPWGVYYSDPFIHDFNMNCTVVNFMSEYGEPELDV